MVQSGYSPYTRTPPLPSQRAKVRVPATSANLGPGFDCLGMAVDLWAEVTVEARPEAPPPTDGGIQAMIEKAALALYEAAGATAPAGLAAPRARGPGPPARGAAAPAGLPPAWAGGQVPLARGLGASACARVGGLMAANALLGAPLSAE